MKARYKEDGKCNLCGQRNEGILFKIYCLIEAFVCESCISGFMKKFRKDK